MPAPPALRSKKGDPCNLFQRRTAEITAGSNAEIPLARKPRKFYKHGEILSLTTALSIRGL
jgi:hypothetical protein